jgi:tetratricopeptide (TPR) repeat protein
VKIAPESSDLIAIRANSLIRQGRIDEGVALLTHIADQNSKRTDYRMLLAGAEQVRNNIDAAMQHYQKVIDADPQHPAALSALGTLLLQKGQHESAEQVLFKAIKAAPNDVVCLNNYVWVTAVELKTPQKALPFAESLQRQAPNNPHVLDTAGWVYYLSGDFPRAVGALSYAAALAPGAPDIAFHHGMALKNDNKAVQALAEFKRALSLKQDFKNASEAERMIRELEKQKLVDGTKTP